MAFDCRFTFIIHIDFYTFKGFVIIKLHEQIKMKSFSHNSHLSLPWLWKLFLLSPFPWEIGHKKKLAFPIKNRSFPSHFFLKKQFSEPTDLFLQTKSHNVNKMSKFQTYYISTSFRLARNSNASISKFRRSINTLGYSYKRTYLYIIKITKRINF